MTTKLPKLRLSQAIVDDLAKSGLTPQDASKLGWHEDIAGNLIIPYNNGTGFERKRMKTPREIVRQGKASFQRYHQTRGTKPELFLAKLGEIDWDNAKTDTSIPLVITEGEKKAAAACKVGLACIGLSGVDCWASKGAVPLQQWSEFAFAGREVIIAFDSDIAEKPQVKSAARRLAQMLILLGATVSVAALPSEATDKVGLDDFLVANGLARGNLKSARAAFEALPTTHVTKTPTEDEITTELNERFAVVSVKGQTLILEEYIDTSGVMQPEFRKLADLNLLLRNRYARGRDGKEISAVAAWLGHPMRREYKRVVFEPSGAEINEYNLWQGLSVNPVPGDCSLLLAHIKDVICAGHEEHFQYVLAWCADMLRHPTNRIGVAIAIRGEEGVGKGIFGQVLMRLTAPYSVQVTQGLQVIGRFNSILSAKLLVFMDEAFWAGDKQYEGVLKGLITEKELVIEHKGKEPIKVSNYARILMASNSEWVVPAGHGARRYFVLDASDGHKGETAYFAKLVAHIDDGGLEAFANFLMNFDLTKVDLRKPPKTEGLLEQKLETMDSTNRFIYEMLIDGSNDTGLRWESAVPTDKLHERYLDTAKMGGDRYPSNRTKFGLRLRKVLKLDRERKMINLNRHFSWKFPTLEECRKRFDKYMEAEIDWPEITTPTPSHEPSTRKRRQF